MIKYAAALNNEELQVLRSWFDEALDKTGFEKKFSFKYEYYDIETDILQLKDKNVIYEMERTRVSYFQAKHVCELIKSITGYKNLIELDFAGMFFVRVHLPSGLHIDELKDDALKPVSTTGYTFIIPLTYSKNISTVGFKKSYDSLKKMLDEMNNYNSNNFKTTSEKNIDPMVHKLTNHVNHAVPYFEYKNHVTWEKGSLIEFSAGQVHCSSNFRPYHEYKDYVLWHARTKINC
jgi:hypothetical protein